MTESEMRHAVDEHKRSCQTCGGVVDDSAPSLPSSEGPKKRAPENGSNGEHAGENR